MRIPELEDIKEEAVEKLTEIVKENIESETIEAVVEYPPLPSLAEVKNRVEKKKKDKAKEEVIEEEKIAIDGPEEHEVGAAIEAIKEQLIIKDESTDDEVVEIKAVKKKTEKGQGNKAVRNVHTVGAVKKNKEVRGITLANAGRAKTRETAARSNVLKSKMNSERTGAFVINEDKPVDGAGITVHTAGSHKKK